MRQQFVEAAVELSWQSRQHIAEVGPGIVSVEPGRLHQAHDHSGAFAREFAAREQPRPAPRGSRTDLVLAMVVVYRHL